MGVVEAPGDEPGNGGSGRPSVRKRRSARIGLGGAALVLLAIVVAVNVVGVWQIAITRRGVVAERRHLLRVEAEAGAALVERTLAATRGDLAFLAASPALGALGARPPTPDTLADEGGSGAAGEALLLFVRGHPEVERVRVESGDGAVLFVAGRPRGVAGLWIPSPGEAAAMRPEGAAGWPPLSLGIPVRGTALRLRAFVGTDALGAAWTGAGEPPRLACRLHDAMGRTLVPARSSAGPAPGDEVSIPVRAEGWPQAPWWLRCRFGSAREAALLEPVLSRYRTTLVLDLVMLGLAIVLGAVALLQTRGRHRSEARAEAEAAAREFERALLHAERLSTVGRLAAGIAHEINNPLEGMSNYLRLAEEQLGRRDAAATRRSLGSVREGLDRVAGVVRGVLGHARPATASSAPTSVGQTVARTTEFVRSRPEYARLRFALDLTDGDAKVVADPVALGQVFLNLVLNACEVQPGGGEVHVTTRVEGRELVAEVADRGPGVRAEDRERIFRPFVSTKGSSGLGLFVCREIVRQHGGDLDVHDRPGGGAVFTVRLPLAASATP